MQGDKPQKYVQSNVSPPHIGYEACVVGEQMNEGQMQWRRAEARPNVGTVSTVNVVGYWGALERSLAHLRDIYRSTY